MSFYPDHQDQRDDRLQRLDAEADRSRLALEAHLMSCNICHRSGHLRQSVLSLCQAGQIIHSHRSSAQAASVQAWKEARRDA